MVPNCSRAGRRGWGLTTVPVAWMLGQLKPEPGVEPLVVDGSMEPFAEFMLPATP